MLSSLLIRLFVRDKDNLHSPQVRYAYGRLAGFVGLACNVLLFLIKLLAGLLSGSLAIIADGFNNLSDAGSGLVTLLGFKLAGRPADKDHPFGHGRMEYLTALAVAALIMIAGFELASSAFQKILHPTPSSTNLLTFVILGAAIAVKGWMAVFYRVVGGRIRSDALLAAGTDSRNDVLCTAVVLVSALVSRFTDLMIDGYVGVAVALFVMWSGFSIMRETVSPLLGQAPDPAFVNDIADTVLAHEGVVGIHDMLVHDYGPGRVIVSLHAEVPVEQDISVSHDIVDCIEQELLQKFNVLSCIHMDPVDFNNPETQRLKALVCSEATAIDEGLTVHDFRAVAGETHTNLLFDLVVPYSAKDADALAVELQERIHRQDEKLFAIIRVEKSFT